MKYFLLLILYTCSFRTTAQDVIVYLTGYSNGIETPMSALEVYNLSDPDTLMFPDLPQEVSTYELNLSNGTLLNGINEINYRKGNDIKLLVNNRNSHILRLTVLIPENISFSILSLDGKLLRSAHKRFAPGNYNIEVLTKSDYSITLFSVFADNFRRSFKLIGGESKSYDFLINNSVENPSEVKIQNIFDFKYKEGDVILFKGLKPGFYSNFSVKTPANGDSVSINLFVPCPESPIVTDYDGNTYQTIQLFNQCWMRENLRTKHYADGTPLIDGTGMGVFKEILRQSIGLIMMITQGIAKSTEDYTLEQLQLVEYLPGVEIL